MINVAMPSRLNHPSIRPGRARLSLADKIQVYLVACYVPLSGIFWVPGLSASTIASAKQAAFITLLFFGLLRFGKRLAYPPSVVFFLLVGAAICFSANLITSSLGEAVEAARGYLEPALWLIALLGIRKSAQPMLVKLLLPAFLLLLPFAAFPILANFGLAPNIYPPSDLVLSEFEYYNDVHYRDAVSAAVSGFTASRTGWGIVISTSAMLVIALLHSRYPAGLRSLFLPTVIFLVAVSSIAITSARSGTLALVVSFIAFIYANYSVPPKHKLALSVGAVGIVIILQMTQLTVLPETFLRGIGDSNTLMGTINAVSTGRLETYVSAIETVAKSPIVGVGREGSLSSLSSGALVLPHNLWLRTASESGLVAFVAVSWLTVVLVLMAVVSARAIKCDRADSGSYRMPQGASAVILCGLVLAMVEPSVIIGSMNTNITFWTAVWFARCRVSQLRSNDHPSNYNG